MEHFVDEELGDVDDELERCDDTRPPRLEDVADVLNPDGELLGEPDSEPFDVRLEVFDCVPDGFEHDLGCRRQRNERLVFQFVQLVAERLRRFCLFPNETGSFAEEAVEVLEVEVPRPDGVRHPLGAFGTERVGGDVERVGGRRSVSDLANDPLEGGPRVFSGFGGVTEELVECRADTGDVDACLFELAEHGRCFLDREPGVREDRPERFHLAEELVDRGAGRLRNAGEVAEGFVEPFG